MKFVSALIVVIILVTSTTSILFEERQDDNSLTFSPRARTPVGLRLDIEARQSIYCVANKRRICLRSTCSPIPNLLRN